MSNDLSKLEIKKLHVLIFYWSSIKYRNSATFAISRWNIASLHNKSISPSVNKKKDKNKKQQIVKVRLGSYVRITSFVLFNGTWKLRVFWFIVKAEVIRRNSDFSWLPAVVILIAPLRIYPYNSLNVTHRENLGRAVNLSRASTSSGMKSESFGLIGRHIFHFQRPRDEILKIHRTTVKIEINMKIK